MPKAIRLKWTGAVAVASALLLSAAFVVQGTEWNDADRFGSTPRSDSVADTGASVTSIGGVAYLSVSHEEGRDANVRVFESRADSARLRALPDPTTAHIDSGAPTVITGWRDRPCVSFLEMNVRTPSIRCFDPKQGRWEAVGFSGLASSEDAYVSDLMGRGNTMWVILTRLRRPRSLVVASNSGHGWTVRGRPVRQKNAIGFFEQGTGGPPLLSVSYGAGRSARRSLMKLRGGEWRESVGSVGGSFGSTLSGSVELSKEDHLIPDNNSLPASSPWRFSVRRVNRRTDRLLRPAPLNRNREADAQGGIWLLPHGQTYAAWVELMAKRAGANGVAGSLYVARLDRSGRRFVATKRLWHGLTNPFFPLGVASVDGRPFVMFSMPQGERNQGSRIVLIDVQNPANVKTY